MKQTHGIQKSLVHIPTYLPPVLALVALAVTPARADWPNNNPTKYYQPPDFTDVGYNVLAAQPPLGSALSGLGALTVPSWRRVTRRLPKPGPGGLPVPRADSFRRYPKSQGICRIVRTSRSPAA